MIEEIARKIDLFESSSFILPVLVGRKSPIDLTADGPLSRYHMANDLKDWINVYEHGVTESADDATKVRSNTIKLRNMAHK